MIRLRPICFKSAFIIVHIERPCNGVHLGYRLQLPIIKFVVLLLRPVSENDVRE